MQGGSKLLGQQRRNVGLIKGLWKLSKESENGFGDGVKKLLDQRGVVVQLYVLKAVLQVAMDDEGK